MKTKFIIFTFLLLTACFEDRFRYICQDPNHFGDAQCQKPVCEFNQNCPEYLVAPVLEKKIEGITSSPVQQPQGTPVCR